MPTPAKPISVIKQEGNKRRLSKAAIQHRENAEKKLTSGFDFQEWDSVKNNVHAHKEYLRLKKIFKQIEKDDALHESSINRFCLLHAECIEVEEMIQKNKQDMINLENERITNSDLDFISYQNIKTDLSNIYMKLDKKLMEKRRAMLDLEKENIMTIASALRSIPKKPPEEKEIDPIEAMLRGG